MGAYPIGVARAFGANWNLALAGLAAAADCDDCPAELDATMGWLTGGATDWVVVAAEAATTPTVSCGSFEPPDVPLVFLFLFRFDWVDGPPWPSLLEELV